jgi:hypothetical protein
VFGCLVKRTRFVWVTQHCSFFVVVVVVETGVDACLTREGYPDADEKSQHCRWRIVVMLAKVVILR